MDNILFELESMKNFLDACNKQAKNDMKEICQSLGLHNDLGDSTPKFERGDIVLFLIDNRKYKVTDISINNYGAYFYDIISISTDDKLKLLAISEIDLRKES